jgi:hypothetical protein
MPNTRVITEARFAVGARHAPKSSIWKAETVGDDVYIFTRMFGADIKISIHASGQCNWSLTNNGFKRMGLKKNAERHMKQWTIMRPSENKAEMVFQIKIPVSEIRQYTVQDKKKVFWIENAPGGTTVRIIFYIAPSSEQDPASYCKLPYRHLFSLKFRSGGWFVALMDLISLSEMDLCEARKEVKKFLAQKDTKKYVSDLRACLFIEGSVDQPCGILELALDN